MLFLTLVRRAGNKTEAELDKYKKYWENAKQKLSKKEEECKIHMAELAQLQRAAKNVSGEMKSLQAKVNELDQCKKDLAIAQKRVKELEKEVTELTEKYTKEMLLRVSNYGKCYV